MAKDNSLKARVYKGDVEHDDPQNLCRIKDLIKESYDYFKDNYKDFDASKRFIMLSALSDHEVSVLQTTGKPQIEFPILEAFISRLRGEFAKHEPSVETTKKTQDSVNPQIIELIDGHIRQILDESAKEGVQYNAYSEQLYGGFSAFKVWTEYESPYSFKHKIKFGKVFDPTLVGFDKNARLPTKTDGSFCFEIFPKKKDEAKAEFPDLDLDGLKYTQEDVQGFNWSYNDGANDIVLVVDFYEKHFKEETIYLLNTGESVTKKEYEQAKERMEMAMVTVPEIVKTKKESIPVIYRYRLVENQIVEFIETDYDHLPIVFIDGNSILSKKENGAVKQRTKCYVRNAFGAQKLKNFAGQCLANELENSMQYKLVVSQDSIPKESLEIYKNPQIASTLPFKEFLNDDPNVRLSPPMPLARPPIPQEFMAAFQASDPLTQTILGAYDASLGINNNQLSGKAIEIGAMQTNAASDPYIINLMLALTQVCQIIVDLIPKYTTNYDYLPVKQKDGKTINVPVNQDDSIPLNYRPSSLNVRVEAGANFAIQKSRTLQMIVAGMQASPIFAQFVNEECLDILLDNMDLRGIDLIKERAGEFMQKVKQQQAMAQQAAQQQQNPAVMQMQLKQAQLMQDQKKMALQAQEAQAELELKRVQLALEQEKMNNEKLNIMQKAQVDSHKLMMEADRSNTEKMAKEVELQIKAMDVSHKHNLAAHKLHSDNLMRHYENSSK